MGSQLIDIEIGSRTKNLDEIPCVSWLPHRIYATEEALLGAITPTVVGKVICMDAAEGIRISLVQI